LLVVGGAGADDASVQRTLQDAGAVVHRLPGRTVGVFVHHGQAEVEALSTVRVGLDLGLSCASPCDVLAATARMEDGRLDAADLDRICREAEELPTERLALDETTRDLLGGELELQRQGRHLTVAPDAATSPDADDIPAAPGGQAEDLEGTMVDHFRVIRLLGRGGMGEVYLARDTRLGRKVALKLVHPELLTAETSKRFLFEARATARFSHPHIVTIHNVGDFSGRPYVALEYLEGQDLRVRVAEKPPGQQEVMRVAMAVAEALAEAHDHGILHRDLKPENVVIPRDGRVRVVDFGLAQRVSRPAASGEALQAELTWPLSVEELEGRGEGEGKGKGKGKGSSGEVAGTPAYMSPERWMDEECSGAADVWALGVMLFELLTGRQPFGGRELAQLALTVCGPEPSPRVDQHEPVPAELSDLVAACLEKDPEARPAAREVAEQLSRLLYPASRADHQQSPYRGLLAFTEAEAPMYFGREPEVTAFVERLRQQTVLPVVAPSGAGKSSFVQAGVIPRLREQDRWIALTLRPGSTPLETLATRLVRRDSAATGRLLESGGMPRKAGSRPGEPSLERHNAELLARRLQESPRQLSLLLAEMAADEGARVLLFVDQLEELFTLVEDAPARRSFLEAIFTAADDPAEPVRVVFTIRDDYLGRLATGPEAREALRDVTVLQRLSAEALEEVLVRPAQMVGYRFEDPAMVGRMVQSVAGEPAGLPLLQFAAQVLWERRDTDRKLLLRAAHDEMGGVEGALARHASGVLEGLSPAELGLARQLLLRLVTAERTRRVITRAEALEGLGEPGTHVLRRLTRARLVSASRTAQGETDDEAMLELAHESLIHSWSTLSRWIDSSREELSFLAEAGQAARLWERRGRRPAELWTGDALHDALRALRRCDTAAPELVNEFLRQAERLDQKKVRRRRLTLGAGVALLALIAAASVGVAWVVQGQRTEAQNQRGKAQKRRAEALVEGARAALGRGEVLESRAKLRAALEISDSSAARALWWRLRADPQVWQRQLGARFNTVAVSPAGDQVATAGGDHSVYLLNANTRQFRVLRGHAAEVFSVAFSPRGDRFASGDHQGQIRVWDASSGALLRVLRGHTKRIYGLSFSPSGEVLASGGVDRTIRLWDVATGKVKQTLRGHDDRVFCVRFSRDGRLLASSGYDKSVRLWDLSKGTSKTIYQGKRGAMIFGLAFNGQGLLAGGCSVGLVFLWDVATGEERRRLVGHSRSVFGVDFSRDGKLLASGSHDSSVRIWDATTWTERRKLTGHEGTVYGVAFGPRGRLASASSAGEVRLWDTAAAPRERKLTGHSRWVNHVTFSPDGKLLASSGNDGTVRIWETLSGVQRRVLQVDKEAAFAAAFRPGRNTLATVSADKTVRVFNATTGYLLQSLSGHRSFIYGLDFSPNGKLLATAGWDTSVQIWDPQKDVRRKLLLGHKGGVYDVAFSRDGKLVASGSRDRTVRLWDVESGATRQILRGHTAAITTVAYSPDGKLLASGGEDRTVRIWDMGLDPPTSRLFGSHTGRISGVAFSPDGRRLGVSAIDGTARVWNLGDGSFVALRGGHRGRVTAVAFHPDGGRVATAGDDGTVRVWDATTGRPRWRAPLLLERSKGAPLLLTHRGWITLAHGSLPSADVPATSWRRAVERRARFAAVAGAKSLCLATHDDHLELWDLLADRRLVRHKLPGLAQVAAPPGGCVALVRGEGASADHRVVFVPSTGKPRTLAKGDSVTAVALAGPRILVAAGERVLSFDSSGALEASRKVAPGATSLTRAGQWLVAGYADGNMELWPTGQQKDRPTFSFEQAPSSPVTRMLPGPMKTLIAGYANGSIGIWSLEDGKRLEHARIHGPVVHLLQHGRGLYAATSLGQHLSWDLGVFFGDHCALLEGLWKQVNVTWDRGQPVVRPARKDHPCRAKKNDEGMRR